MTATTSATRGRLPRAVYWRRRAFVLGVVAALVLTLVGLVRGGDGPGVDDTAAIVAGTPSTSPDSEATAPADASPGTASGGPRGPDRPLTREERQARKERRDRKRAERAEQAESTPPAYTPPPLAEPDGACDDADVTVGPIVAGAVAGEDVTITLVLRTRTAAACTWRLSANHLALKITDGTDEVWTSRECGRMIPPVSLVVRQAVSSTTTLTWNSRRSEEGCPRETRYAEPGDYTVSAAAIGGEPAESTFDLAAPTADVIEVPAEPSRSPGRAPGRVPDRAPGR